MSSRKPPESLFAPIRGALVEEPKRHVRRIPISQETKVPSPTTPVLSAEDRNRFRISVPPVKRSNGPGGARKSPPVGEKWEVYVEDARRRMADEDTTERTDVWKDATPWVFVALYTLMHERIYGAEVSMSGNDRVVACSMVKRLLATKFSDSAEEFTWFLSWAWGDEKLRWANSKHSRRLSWKWLFTTDKFDDWQASMRRKREKKKERDLVDVGMVRR